MSDYHPLALEPTPVWARPKRSRWWIAAAIGACLFFAYLVFGDHTVVSQLAESTKQVFGGSASASPQKITVILIWQERGEAPPAYAPYFFQSVEANPDVNLLLINVDKEGKGCTNFSNATNVQEVCLSEAEYHQLHVDFLCERWQCTEEDRKNLLNELVKRAAGDPNNSFFRILRNGIFSKYIDPKTTIWGWCDADTYWGNFSRVFPWDIAPNYDILAVAGQPAFSNQRLLFTRGHMAFFRNTPEVLEKMHAYPKFSSLSSFLMLPETRKEAEESEFSHYLFAERDDFTFITFEGMANAYDATVFISAHGVFYSDVKQEEVDVDSDDIRRRLLRLVSPTDDRKAVRPTFSDEGSETETRLYLNGSHYEGALWFPEQYATYVETGWDDYESHQKAYFMRREAHGPVSERTEQRARYLSRDADLAADEALYKHWQGEKREAWFKRIPQEGLKKGEVFVQYHQAGAEIWDEDGNVIFETGSN